MSFTGESKFNLTFNTTYWVNSTGMLVVLERMHGCKIVTFTR